MAMPKDRRNLKSYQTTDWFNKNLIVIKAAYRSVGDEIKEKCKQSNILYYYGGHSIDGGDEYIGRMRVWTDEYRVEIKETGLKVKELTEWALNKFNTKTKDDVWIEILPLPLYWFSPWRNWPGKDKDLPPETNAILVNGVATLKVDVQKETVDTDNQEQ